MVASRLVIGEDAGMTTALDLVPELERAGVRDIRADALTRGMYSTDASLYRVVPQVVVCPHDAAEVAAALRRDHPDAVEFSAGMSGDIEEAVAAGSTCVRVGTAILGPRPVV